MCGICGVYSPDGAAADEAAVRRMRAGLAHRGPDDEGEFFDGPAGFGFRRLSILDLAGGHQPMSTADGRLTVVFNGEIYNHQELRRELAGARWRTRSDTETILELYARDGVGAFARLNGMFAVAVWDKARQELVLARDPIGIKPLYYSYDGRGLAFSSEVRSLLAGGLVSPELDWSGVLEYLGYGKAHAPRTVLRDVRKLPPAHYLRLSRAGLSIERYWEWPRPLDAPAPPLAESADALEKLLMEAVRSHRLSDVPVGVFLSGGLDSSLIAAFMAREGGAKKVASFSVGFDGAGAGVDESSAARRVAGFLGTEHHELRLPADVLSGFEEAIGLLDEPIADSAILPTYLLAKHAAGSVKAALSGEGADELFAGYGRYKAAWVNERLWSLPVWIRGLAAPPARRAGKGPVFASLPFSSSSSWAWTCSGADRAGLQSLLAPGLASALEKWEGPRWAFETGEIKTLNQALAFDAQAILPDSLLMKADKSTMRASLEARVPFLDKRVVEYASRLPSSYKMRRFKGKYILRLVAERHLPRDIAWRRKHGFIVPWEAWARSPANASAGRLLEGRALEPLFDRAALRAFRARLAAGDRGADAGLFFRILVLGLWLESLRPELQAAHA